MVILVGFWHAICCVAQLKRSVGIIAPRVDVFVSVGGRKCPPPTDKPSRTRRGLHTLVNVKPKVFMRSRKNLTEGDMSKGIKFKMLNEGGMAFEQGAGMKLNAENLGCESSEPDQFSAATPSNDATALGGVGGGAYILFGKRMFDIVFASAFMLVIGFWLIPLIGLLIKLESRGPMFFLQGRAGEGGSIFKCVKFRTMTHDPHAGFVQARKDDPRVTRVGAVLRKANLDELPQFINVLKGEMSVVGPRPHVPELDEIFGELVPGYKSRTIVRPGVTGLAQVSGCRGETKSIRNMSHRVRFDLFYAKNMSFWVDIRIVVATVIVAIKGDAKAY